jgi:transposase
MEKMGGGISMEASYHLHDMSDAAWALIKPHTIGNKGDMGRQRTRHEVVYQRSVLDLAHRRTMVGLAA